MLISPLKTVFRVCALAPKCLKNVTLSVNVSVLVLVLVVCGRGVCVSVLSHVSPSRVTEAVKRHPRHDRVQRWRPRQDVPGRAPLALQAPGAVLLCAHGKAAHHSGFSLRPGLPRHSQTVLQHLLAPLLARALGKVGVHFHPLPTRQFALQTRRQEAAAARQERLHHRQRQG